MPIVPHYGPYAIAEDGPTLTLSIYQLITGYGP